jgi:signal-transduction protein with cAMP-binding, CBS, and nucleotidyltransferase domain
MRIGDVCTYEVATCLRGVSAREVARVMRDRQVDDVVVVEPCNSEMLPIGIVTDRDLVVRIVAAGCDADALTAGDVMHDQVATAFASESVYDAVRRMEHLGIGLPVVNERRHLVGIVAAGDIVRLMGQELSEVGRIGPHRIEAEGEAAPWPGPSHWPPWR